MEQLFILTINELIRQSGQTLEDKTCGLILSTTKGNIDLLARHTEHPDEAVFLWKWQKTLPVISMLRNGYMSSPTPAYQECQPL